jgi:pyruvate dehydrogenase E2 component (dihydrolipoamide acetyltransferase)
MAQIVNMPKLGFDMAEGVLVRWVVAEGETVAKGAVLAEIETDKATVEVESAYGGTLLRQLVPQGTVVPINDPIAVIGESGEEVNLDALLGRSMPAAKSGESGQIQAAQAVETVPTSGEILVSPEKGKDLLASPLARSMASQLGIDLHLVQGSGPGGRITKKDILAFQVRTPGPVAAKAQLVTPVPVLAAQGETSLQTRSVPIPKLRMAIGRRMTESVQQVPHFYVTHEYDVAALLDRRKEINALLGEDDKLSVNDFIVRAVALTLLGFPNLNASIDLKNSMLIYHGEINVGVAVAVENGLLTVVSRNTDQKTVHQISSELKNIVKRARDGKVRPEDIEGSTFTVSNLGMYEVDQFTAIINPPEAAILAVGSARQVPVVIDGAIKISTRMKATLSVDHRISDGAEGARFLQALVRYIEEPMRLIL